MAKKNHPEPLVYVEVVFVDSLGHPIQGLNVKLTSKDLDYTGTTDENGVVVPPPPQIKRGQEISFLVKKKDGTYVPKGELKTPIRDINTYTIRSPELHLEATTKLTPKEELEEDLHLPTVKVGEIMTIERFFGEFAPYIGAVEIVTEVGKVLKDSPTVKKTMITNQNTGKQEEKDETEHHYSVVKTDKPNAVPYYALNNLILNYPTSKEITKEQYSAAAKELGCEVRAIKAFAKKETRQSPFLPNGLPAILFERHVFFRCSDPEGKKEHKRKAPHPYAKFSDICNPIQGKYNYLENGVLVTQYERLVKAGKLDMNAAIQACSWGAFQVLAEPYKEMGYSSPMELVDDCMKSIEGQMKLFVRFMKLKNKETGIIKHLNNKEWGKVGSAYNGASAPPSYSQDLEKYYNEEKND